MLHNGTRVGRNPMLRADSLHAVPGRPGPVRGLLRYQSEFHNGRSQRKVPDQLDAYFKPNQLRMFEPGFSLA